MRKVLMLTLLIALCICQISAQNKPKKYHFIFFPRIDWGLNYFHLLKSYPESGFEVEKRSLRANPSQLGRKPQLGDFFLGYKLHIVPTRKHIGAFMYVDYKNKGLALKKAKEEEWTSHKTHILSPAIGLRYTTGDFTKSVRWAIECGAAYNFVFGYKGDFNYDLNAVNNGFNSIIGFGFDFIPGRRDKEYEEKKDNGTTVYSKERSTQYGYTSITLQYHRDWYYFFNDTYVPTGTNEYPFKGFKNGSGYICLVFTKRIGLRKLFKSGGIEDYIEYE